MTSAYVLIHFVKHMQTFVIFSISCVMKTDDIHRVVSDILAQICQAFISPIVRIAMS